MEKLEASGVSKNRGLTTYIVEKDLWAIAMLDLDECCYALSCAVLSATNICNLLVEW